MDGASALSLFFYIVLPHLARPITVVILIETIFLLNVFAEICVTTGGGRAATTNLALPRLFGRRSAIRRRRGLGRRHRRGHPRQHRRLLPRPHRRQEPGRLSHGTRSHSGAQGHRHRRRLGRRLPHLLPDPLDDPDELQDRARGLLACRRNSCSSTGRLENYADRPGAQRLFPLRAELDHHRRRLDPPRLCSSPCRRPGPWRSRRPSAPRTCCCGCCRPR